MTSQRTATASLFIGAILMMLVFAFHPSRITMTPVLGPFNLSQLVHGTALFAVPFLLLGLWQMAEWLNPARPVVRSGLLLAGLAMVMTLNAAVISNFVTPAVARATMGAIHGANAAPMPSAHGHPAPMSIAQMPPLLQLSVSLNRGFAQVHIAFLSLGILLFGVALLGRHRLLGAAGILVGLYPVLWQLTGTFSPETTTVPLIVFPQGIWLIAVGVAMWRGKDVD